MYCYAYSLYPATVSILKKTRRGRLVPLATESVIANMFRRITVVSHTFQPEEKAASEGDYVCRATAGNQTIDSPIQVIAAEAPTFDDQKTGVVRNTSKRVVISCKASGKPKPTLRILLYDGYGPDLMESGLFKVSQRSPDKFTTRVTLTLPAVGSKVHQDKIHTVVCSAEQGHQSYQFAKETRMIEVFPGIGWSGLNTDMGLYYRLQD